VVLGRAALGRPGMAAAGSEGANDGKVGAAAGAGRGS